MTETKNKSVVKVKARLYDNGDFEIIPYDLKKFKRFIKKIDIVRGIFWSKHIVSKWGEKGKIVRFPPYKRIKIKCNKKNKCK